MDKRKNDIDNFKGIVKKIYRYFMMDRELFLKHKKQVYSKYNKIKSKLEECDKIIAKYYLNKVKILW